MTQSPGPLPWRSEVTLDYLEIPFLFEYRLRWGGPVEGHLFAGPAMALKLGCRVEAAAGEATARAQCSVYGMYPKETDTGLLVGAGTTLAVTEGVRLLLEGRYTLGVGSIDSSSVRADVKNRAFQLNAVVVIPTGEWTGSG